MQFILINGKKRSGKDHFAQMLQDEMDNRGITSEIMPYADPIKMILAETFNITLEELEQFKNKSAPIAVKEFKVTNGRYKQVTNMRSVLQNFGTEAMKTWFGENVWVDLLLNQASESDADFVIIPDFRFKSEYIEDNCTIHILNNAIQDDKTSEHISENELNDFDFDYILDNTDYKLTSEDASTLLDMILGIE